jgi:hypothetical protein
MTLLSLYRYTYTAFAQLKCFSILVLYYNEIRSQTLDLTVCLLEGAKTHESSAWVLLGKVRKGEKTFTIISVLKHRQLKQIVWAILK